MRIHAKSKELQHSRERDAERPSQRRRAKTHLPHQLRTRKTGRCRLRGGRTTENSSLGDRAVEILYRWHPLAGVARRQLTRPSNPAADTVAAFHWSLLAFSQHFDGIIQDSCCSHTHYETGLQPEGARFGIV